jgi:hypothetical protein
MQRRPMCVNLRAEDLRDEDLFQPVRRSPKGEGGRDKSLPDNPKRAWDVAGRTRIRHGPIETMPDQERSSRLLGRVAARADRHNNACAP